MSTAVKTTRKAKPSKKKAAQPEAPPRQPSWIVLALRKMLFRPVVLLLLAVSISLVVLAPHVPAMLPDLKQLEEYQFDLDQMRVNAPNGWVPATLIDDVLASSGLPNRVSLLEPNLSRDISLALENHPWVRKARLVRLTNEPALQALIEYRVPVAFVRTQQGYYPIDAEGVILPLGDFTETDFSRLPWILNATEPANPQPGEKWELPAIEAAAEIAGILTPEGNMERYWKHFRLTGILLPAATNESLLPEEMTFELLTAGGSRVVWGRPPGHDDLEPTPEQKLGRMEQYIERFGDFDSPDGPYRIDIRLFDAISLEPLHDLRYR